jgi:hypothetical protein
MAQCNCETYFNRWYYKYTHFWEPDNEANRDVIDGITQDFNLWVRFEELLLRDREYDNSETVTYSCANNNSGGNNCSCLYIRKRSYRDLNPSLDGLDASPDDPPDDFNGRLEPPYNIRGTCSCTVVDTGASYTETPEAGQQPVIETLKSEFFAIVPTYKLTATEITAQGCQGNVPRHLAYNELPFPITRDQLGPTFFLKYKLKRQRTKWIRSYTNLHTCP